MDSGAQARHGMVISGPRCIEKPLSLATTASRQAP